MKPLFSAETKTAVPTGFQEVFQPEQAHPVVVAQPVQRTAIVASVVSDADINKLGERNAARAAQISSKILANVRASDTETFGTKLNELVATTKKLDPKKMGTPGFFGKILGFGGTVKEKLMAEYATVETQMNRLVSEVDGVATLALKRVDDLDVMFEENYQTHVALENDVAAGKQMVAHMEAQIQSLGTPTDAFGAQQIADMQARVDRLLKRIDDFERGMQLAKLAAPEIRMLQQHERSLANSVRDIKVTTIPAWQGVFSRYVIALEAKKGAEIINKVYDATDEAFRMQADQLRENAQNIARAQQRSVVTIETLEHMQTQLLGAVDDTLRIAKEGRDAREAAKPKLKQLEQGLIQRFSPQHLISN
jgi:uncharacterized protein YaaN involved in tellurite resistance